MRLLLGGMHSLQQLRQIALKLYAIHLQPLSPIYCLWLLIVWPFRLYSSGGAHVISNAPCATATCCFRSNTRPSQLSHYARSLERRAVKRSYDNPAASCQPLFAAASGQLSPSGVYP